MAVTWRVQTSPVEEGRSELSVQNLCWLMTAGDSTIPLMAAKPLLVDVNIWGY